MLPTGWVHDRELRSFRWADGTGSANTAALMALMNIAHFVDDDGNAKLTYNQICDATGLSRAKLSQGLSVLCERRLIDRTLGGRSAFRLVGFNPREGWGKLPARRLYGKSGAITAFSDFTLRNLAELNALKIYYLLVAFRDNASNLAHLSYDKFEEIAGIDRARIKTALSILINAGLIHIERVPSTVNEYGMSSAYRLVGLDPYRHPGTTGRADIGDRLAETTQTIDVS